MDPKVLTTLVETLQGLAKGDERLRAVGAAMTFLGEPWPPEATSSRNDGDHKGAKDNGSEDPNADKRIHSAARSWLRQQSVSIDELENVFNFAGGEFSVLEVPGTKMRERALNTYVLQGLGTFLTTGNKTFADDGARNACQSLGCLDQGNHAKTLKERNTQHLAGDKDKGWTITSPGLKEAAALVKALNTGA